MSGFCIECSAGQGSPMPRLIDLAGCDAVEGFRAGQMRAVWASWPDSGTPYVRRAPGALLFVEGHPDRHPREDEALKEWLPGRWGSFRGFEIREGTGEEPGRLTVFSDPFASRPLYFLPSRDGLLIADKLSTLALNSRRPADVSWGGLLESLVLGSLYSRQTTLEGVEYLLAGEVVEFQGTALVSRSRRDAPVDGGFDPERARRDPGGSLAEAVRKAVRETWTDSGTWLLLSGGLDSRLMLALAGANRKALTLDLYPAETAIARSIAASCGAEHVAVSLPEGHYLHLLRCGHLLTGAIGESRFASHLGLGREWRRRGIRSVAHGFLFDAVLKASFCYRRRRWIDERYSPLLDLMGAKADGFLRTASHVSSRFEDNVILMLSPGGRDLLREQLARLAGEMTPVVADGIDATMERLLMRNLTRDIFYPVVLGWMEELDVVSPIFHPSIWAWYAATMVADRLGGKSVRAALLGLEHPVRDLADANTGRRIELPKPGWTDRFLESPLYPVLRPAWRRMNALVHRTPKKLAMAAEFRRAEGRQILEQGLAALESISWFDMAVVRRMLERFLAAEDELLEPLMAAAGAGQWVRFVQDGPANSGPAVSSLAGASG